MGREIGWKVEGGRWKRSVLVKKCEGLESGKTKDRIGDLVYGISDWRRPQGVRVIAAGPVVCRKIGIVTGGFGDLDQVVRAGLDTLITGEADYPTEVKARELGINLILGGHRETETFGAERLAGIVRKLI
jgi:putative NIF3 family GTP cyclohydrolase 1 type 2